MKTKEKKISLLREIFLKKYCEKMGWNPNELSTMQLLKISSMEEFIKPTNL